jgi:hypothetical protein
MDETVWEDATGFAERWCAWDGYRRTLGATICTFISLITACFFIFQPRRKSRPFFDNVSYLIPTNEYYLSCFARCVSLLDHRT